MMWLRALGLPQGKGEIELSTCAWWPVARDLKRIKKKNPTLEGLTVEGDCVFDLLGTELLI